MVFVCWKKKLNLANYLNYMKKKVRDKHIILDENGKLKIAKVEILLFLLDVNNSARFFACFRSRALKCATGNAFSIELILL